MTSWAQFWRISRSPLISGLEQEMQLCGGKSWCRGKMEGRKYLPVANSVYSASAEHWEFSETCKMLMPGFRLQRFWVTWSRAETWAADNLKTALPILIRSQIWGSHFLQWGKKMQKDPPDLRKLKGQGRRRKLSAKVSEWPTSIFPMLRTCNKSQFRTRSCYTSKLAERNSHEDTVFLVSPIFFFPVNKVKTVCFLDGEEIQDLAEEWQANVFI